MESKKRSNRTIDFWAVRVLGPLSLAQVTSMHSKPKSMGRSDIFVRRYIYYSNFQVNIIHKPIRATFLNCCLKNYLKKEKKENIYDILSPDV